MEIQKAEEFAHKIYEACGPIGRNIEDGTSWLSEHIRARDKAIIERCKESIHKLYNGFSDPGYCDGILEAEKACDAILRDLN
jgi:hypothetical protein